MIATVNPTRPATSLARYDVLGVRVDLHSDDPAIIATVDASYGVFRVAVDDATDPGRSQIVCLGRAGGRWTVAGASRPEVAPPSRDAAAIEVLDRLVDTVQGGLHRRGLVTVHAATIRVPGGVLLVAATSGSGKTTLALGLAARGHTLLSDELAVIDAAGTIHPYPRALHVRPDTLDLIPDLGFLSGRPRLVLGGGSEWAVTPAELRERWGGDVAVAGPLAAVIIVDGVPGIGLPGVTPLPPAVAALELARGSWAASEDFVGTLGRLAMASADVPCGRLVNGPLPRTLDVLDAWLGETARRASSPAGAGA